MVIKMEKKYCRDKIRLSMTLGRLEESILLSLIRLSQPVTVREIKENIESFHEGISIGALYNTINRIESKELICSTEKKFEFNNGERTVSCFLITKKGKEALNDLKNLDEQMWKGIILEECRV
jgi:PadR family transcriptional regulator, regulatory protein PadR